MHTLAVWLSQLSHIQVPDAGLRCQISSLSCWPCVTAVYKFAYCSCLQAGDKCASDCMPVLACWCLRAGACMLVPVCLPTLPLSTLTTAQAHRLQAGNQERTTLMLGLTYTLSACRQHTHAPCPENTSTPCSPNGMMLRQRPPRIMSIGSTFASLSGQRES